MASGGITVETDPVFSASPAASITDAKKAEWDSKQDKISDLDAIRSGASAGATAVQPNEDAYVWNWNGEQEGALTTEEFDAMYNAKLVILGLFNAPLMKAMGDENNLSLVMSMTSADSVEYLAFMLSREDQTFAMLEQSSFPIGVTEEMISDFGFTKNTGDYSKPQNGIPKSDLASSVQTSLGKADTALQSYTEQYKGTVTSVKINGTTKSPDANGLVDLGTIEGGGSSSGGGEQVEEPYVYDSDGYKIIMFDDVGMDIGYINTPMVPGVTYVCTQPVNSVILYNIQQPTGNTGKYTLHFAVGEEGGYIDVRPQITFYFPNGEADLNFEPYGVYELSIVATKLIDNGETHWLYKAILTSFKY